MGGPDLSIERKRLTSNVSTDHELDDLVVIGRVDPALAHSLAATQSQDPVGHHENVLQIVRDADHADLLCFQPFD